MPASSYSGRRPRLRNRRYLLGVGFLLLIGFVMTSLAAYFVSKAALRTHIRENELPLTSDTLYSEIQRDLLRPILISSLMAQDTFVHDWLLAGEPDELRLRRYLDEIRRTYGTVTSFLVSERTRTYYHADGILKKVSPDEPRDAWFFRVRDLTTPYEINLDPDLANRDALTIFVNHRIVDDQGRFLGATGIGLTIKSVNAMMLDYRRRYDRNVYFVNPNGQLITRLDQTTASTASPVTPDDLTAQIKKLIASGKSSASFQRKGTTLHLNARFIPELNWYLVVEQAETKALRNIFKALIANLFFCIAVTVGVLFLFNFILNIFRRRLDQVFEEELALRRINRDQAESISLQNRELSESNIRLQAALADVKKLSGLLPICASCKKIRDDRGYWNRIEAYIQNHSEAEFSHSICPECSRKLYPEIFPI
jgi:C4-dicarboxylate-specific signal transduction histidine kinase